MTKFEKWCESKGYAVDAGIHTHVLSKWADEFAASEVNRLLSCMRVADVDAYYQHKDEDHRIEWRMSSRSSTSKFMQSIGYSENEG